MNPLANLRKLVKHRDTKNPSPVPVINSNNDVNKSPTARPSTSDITQSNFEPSDPEVVKQVNVIVIGAGQRGQVYASYSQDFPKQLRVVGVAEPINARRAFMSKKYNIAEDCVFKDWKQVAEEEKFADAVIIATLDNLHREPAVAFANKGYHILLEKPMAQTLEDCEAIVEAVKQNNVMLCVAHVLRYTPRYLKVKELIDSGVIGDVVSIQHMEPIGWYHFAHSYVRGNWRRQDESSFTLLTKSCHDIDLINSLMQGSRCTCVSSFGSLAHFTLENKPQNASHTCLTCEAEPDCPYSAVKFYLDPVRASSPNFFTQVVCSTNDVEDMKKALKTGPYGRCVYDCDNDVVSNQVVNMSYEGGRTVSFVMTAFTEKMCQRETKIFGTRGQIKCNEGEPIVTFDFTSRHEQIHKYTPAPQKTKMIGHGFADYHLMHAFVAAVAKNDPSLIISHPEETLAGHRLVFAIEKSRLENRIINLTSN